MSATRPTPADRLSAYRAKRSLGATPEPAGTVSAVEGRLFVVHKHAATQLHYDLRLEMQGVLQSWAVPKGPSADPQEKRLAVKVEDHPLEYGDFEGLIPEGNYGAGAVILWDRGRWLPIEEPEEGLAKGKLLFELEGYKLRGRWTLVRIKKSERDWLLIKERDALATTDGPGFAESSVLSGLTVEELRDGWEGEARIRETLERLGAPARRVTADAVELMLAETRREPFSRTGWIFELKYDGYRIVAGRDQGEARLITRNGHDVTASFPDIARAVRALPFDGVLDGEVVVHDETGRPSFQRLQQRARLTRVLDIRRATVELPAALYVFDLLGFGGFDLRPLPLLERKSLLKQVLPDAGPLKYSDHVDGGGEAFFEQVVKLGLEGMVGKKADAPYRAGRGAQWVKVRADLTDDFVIVGFTEPKGSRGGFGALHLAAYDDGTLVYAGRVGSGFTATELEEIREVFESALRDDPPCTGAPASRDSKWVAPAVVCEVRYKEWTDEGLLRQPVFVRFRTDKGPEECVKRSDVAALEVAAVERPVPVRRVDFTNLDKVFWPDEGYTKGDLIEYYRSVARWMLPYLEDRPLVMTRYPDGIGGKSFFQKDAPGFAPDWIRRETMWSEDSERELSYFVADNEESLLYIVNLGTIPIHVWASRVTSLEQPDWCILDLDPGDAPFADVVTVARALHALCEAIALPTLVKTSGSSGLHVLVPLGRRCTHEQAKTLGELLARTVAAELPEIATVTRVPSQRERRVYVDFLQNGRGKLLVAPFCVRPLPGAPVSMPLRWREVNAKLDVGRFTIANAASRMRRLGEDPLLPVLELKADLPAALKRLHERLD